MSSKIRIAYLHCGDTFSTIPYYRDLLDALREQSDVIDMDFGTQRASALGSVFKHSKSADIVVLSKSFAERLFPSKWLPYALRAALRGHPLSVGFLANEHRDVPQKLAFLRKAGCQYVATQYPRERVESLYKTFTPATITAFEGCMSPLTSKMNIPPYSERKYDIGFHGVKYPYYLGHQDRTLIYRHLKKLKYLPQWKIDLGDEEKKNFIPGDEFLKQLADTRAVLGSEAGGDFLDLDNTIRKQVIAYENARKADGLETSFEDILPRFEAQFQHARLTQPSGRMVPSRVFEAAATRTLQVLFEGEYGKMFRPWEHYVPLRRDFANWNEVEKIIRDESAASKITTAMLNECQEKYTYSARVRVFLNYMTEKRAG